MEANIEAYVSLVTAQYLKEIGFDVPVRSFYQEPIPGTELEHIYKEHPERHMEQERHDMPCSLGDWNNHKESAKIDRIYYSCPTLAVAQRWMREAKGYEVEPRWYNGCRCYKVGYIKREFGRNWRDVPSRTYKTYEEALEDGILFVIGRIIGENYDIHIHSTDTTQSKRKRR